MLTGHSLLRWLDTQDKTLMWLDEVASRVTRIMEDTWPSAIGQRRGTRGSNPHRRIKILRLRCTGARLRRNSGGGNNFHGSATSEPHWNGAPATYLLQRVVEHGRGGTWNSPRVRVDVREALERLAMAHGGLELRLSTAMSFGDDFSTRRWGKKLGIIWGVSRVSNI